uniref:Uncharacterized protein n=1 Tax=Trichogramma kaykai TaxID=54128 RepID=A0ABD2WUG7_9HYME
MASASEVARKRGVIRSRITAINKVLSNDIVDPLNVSLRLDRVTELFRDYETLTDALTEEDENHSELAQAEILQDEYYNMAARVKSVTARNSSIGSTTNNFGAPVGSSTIIERQQLVKLPVANLPQFDGDHDKWLSFKNTFLSMIDARTDIDELNKFLYLRDCLKGPAFNKLSLYDTSAGNYVRAWAALIDEYEKKRVLIAKHYDGILDIPVLNIASSKELIKMIDEVRQHVNMLESLKVTLDKGIIVRIIETKLPMEIRTKWEESLNFDAFPTFEQLCKFVSESAFRISALETHLVRDHIPTNNKRRQEQSNNYHKSRKIDSGARAFVTNTHGNCPYCSGNHPIFKCTSFENLSIQQRWDFVKKERLCRNCLRSHTGACLLSHCKLCDKFHNTLLHSTPMRDANKKQQRKSDNKNSSHSDNNQAESRL